MRKDLHEGNRRSWNAATRAHNAHKQDQAGFLRRGGSTLFAEELSLLGDVRGRSLLHLQCNAGQDTLSLVSHCGVRATGVDISDEAITFAQQLSQDSGIPAAFVRADVYDHLAEATPRAFDVVFSSYGWMLWLSDLALWAQGVASVLAPGGRFVTMEFHPFGSVWGEDFTLKYPYGAGEKVSSPTGVTDYLATSGPPLAPMGFQDAPPFENPEACHEFTWGIGDLATALAAAGLRIDRLLEFPYTNGFAPFTRMKKVDEVRFTTPDDVPRLPLMFGLVAAKP